MYNTIPTGTDSWKTSLLRLSDSSFSNIMRNYLGVIETPFNKHDLIEKLSAFLNNTENQDKILSLIDDEEAKVINIIYILNERTRILEFFKGEYSQVSLENILDNLEERLIIYRIREKEEDYLYLTPFLKDLLIENIYTLKDILETTPSERQGDQFSWLSWGFIGGFFSYIYDHPSFFKIDGSLKKRAIEDVTLVFPDLLKPLSIKQESNPKKSSGTRLDFVIDILIGSGLLQKEEHAIYPCPDSWQALNSSEDDNFLPILFSSTSIDPLYRNKATRSAERLLSIIPKDLAFSISSLKKMLFILTEEPTIKSYISEILRNLIFSNYLVHVEGRYYAKNNNLNNLYIKQEHEEPPCIIQPNFEVMVKPWIGYKYLKELPLMMQIQRYEMISVYEITKPAFFHCRRMGMNLETILHIFNEISGNLLPQNIAISLHDWETEFQSARILKGIILQLAPSRAKLVDQSGVLENWIVDNPADGIYIMDENQMPLWMEALKNIGINHLEDDSENTKREPNHVASVMDFTPPELDIKLDKTAHETDSKLLRDLSKKLQSNQLTDEQKEEIQDRIDRKIILNEGQLENPLSNKGKAEARGLNYRGKLRLIEDAISFNQLLEIQYIKDDSINNFKIIPDSLDKKESESVLSGYITPGRKFIRIRVNKISVVKKLSRSLMQ